MTQKLNTTSKLNDRQYIQEKADMLFFKNRQRIYCERSTPLGIYIIKTGRVKVSKTGSDGKEQIVRVASKGDSLSYIDLISDTRYSNSATAISDTHLYFLSKETFWDLLRSHPDLFEELLRLLSGDLKFAEEKITDLAYKPVKGRLIDALLRLSAVSVNSDNKELSLYMTRYNLACYIGTAKDTVNRMVSELRDEEMIKTHGNEIRILNPEKLKKQCAFYD